ncbi:MAG: purine-nucleoside phosphorylase [Myxococcales bacterium]|nr:purine-nucleoside phosphorylase [Myxococcales bacterium]
MVTRLLDAANVVKQQIAEPPLLALVLGSGLGALSQHVENPIRIPYSAIPYMPGAGVEGHAGELICGRLSGCPVAVFSGRSHYYEGYPPDAVVFGARLARFIGAHALLLTNAAGGVHTDLRPGDLMVIRDHIHLLTGTNPLRGPNDSRLGVRFPDMSSIYDRELRRLLTAAGEYEDVSLRHGVYACVPGPSYETPAEIRMLRILGADAVGMSTTAEAICARHVGLRVVGLSCITNFGAGLGDAPLSHDEVKEVAGQVAEQMQRLVLRFVALAKEVLV